MIIKIMRTETEYKTNDLGRVIIKCRGIIKGREWLDGKINTM
jgi:hypothetical protein